MEEKQEGGGTSIPPRSHLIRNTVAALLLAGTALVGPKACNTLSTPRDPNIVHVDIHAIRSALERTRYNYDALDRIEAVAAPISSYIPTGRLFEQARDGNNIYSEDFGDNLISIRMKLLHGGSLQSASPEEMKALVINTGINFCITPNTYSDRVVIFDDQHGCDLLDANADLYFHAHGRYPPGYDITRKEDPVKNIINPHHIVYIASETGVITAYEINGSTVRRAGYWYDQDNKESFPQPLTEEEAFAITYPVLEKEGGYAPIAAYEAARRVSPVPGTVIDDRATSGGISIPVPITLP